MNFIKYLLLGLLLCSSNAIFAGTVTIIGDVNAENSSNDQFYLNVLGNSQNVLFLGGGRGVAQLPALYNNQAGVTVTNPGTFAINSNDLNNSDLVVISSQNFDQPTLFSQTDLDLLSSFTGDALLVLEATPGNATALDSFEAVLIALGSSIRYTRDRIQQSFSGPMEANPLTNGVGDFSLAFYNPFTGGTTLLFDNNLNSIVVTEDVNAVPEPSTCIFLLVGFLACLPLRKK